MAGYEPPSFSLGLDLGLDSEPQIAPPDKHPTQTPAPHDEDFGPEVMDSDPESRPEPPRILKRLRRGPTTTPTTKTPSKRELISLFSQLVHYEEHFVNGGSYSLSRIIHWVEASTRLTTMLDGLLGRSEYEIAH
ncbi:hypothetical protein SO802_014611 [Lithocarpus litseifolius]|uniref:Uncharacterized protein n=1 Tax=Lithocarpus litseifolius TaxID=425828 RepID=A0AAW2CUJ1_9ROSI